MLLNEGGVPLPLDTKEHTVISKPPQSRDTGSDRLTTRCSIETPLVQIDEWLEKLPDYRELMQMDFILYEIGPFTAFTYESLVFHARFALL